MAATPNPANLKQLLDAVDRIVKSTPDWEGVQKELTNQGYGDLSEPDVKALIKTVQDRKAARPQLQLPVLEPQTTTTLSPPDTTPESSLGTTEPTPPAEPTAPPSEVIKPPIDEIDVYIRDLYTNRDIERIMKAKFSRTFRAVIMERRKIIRNPHPVPEPQPSAPTVDAGTVGNLAAPEVPSPVGAPNEPFDLSEALKFMQSVAYPQGGSVSQPSILPQAAPFQERFKQWKAAIDTFIKARIPFDGAAIAEQMGSFDIANMVRGQGIQAAMMGQIGQAGGYVPPTAYFPSGYPQPQQQPAANPEDLTAEIMRALRMGVQMQVMMPIIKMMTQTMSAGQDGGNPQLQEMRELMKKQEQDRLMDGLRNEIKGLQQKGQDPAATAQIEQLKWQLNQIQNERNKDAETERLRMAMDASKNSGTNAKDLYEGIAKLNAEGNTKLEMEKLAHQRDVEAATARERAYYTDRLRDLETKLQSIQSSTTMNPMEQYSQMSTLIGQEMERLDKLRAGTDKGMDLPGILKDVAHEFAPAITKFIEVRGPPAARQVGTAAAQATAPQTATPGQVGKVQGQCPWCSQTVVVDDLDQVKCPNCGKDLYPHGAPPTAQAPEGPAGPTPLPVPYTPIETYMGPDGQTHQRRNPSSPVIV